MTTVGFAIVGTGNIAEIHAQAIAAVPGAVLRAVYDRTSAKAEQFVRTFGGVAAPTLADLLARDDVDVVCVATPTGLHGEITLKVLAAGKHVLCEKPLEISTARVDEMIAAAQRSELILAAVFQLRLGHGAQQLKRAVDQGRFGRRSLCSAYVKWWRDPSYYAGSNWKGTVALDGGGALMNQGIHAVDLLQWFAGLPVKITGRVQTRVHPIATEDTATALVEYADGALGVIEVATSCFPGLQMRIEISGDQGTAILENDHLLVWEFAEPEPEDDVIRNLRLNLLRGGTSNPKAIGAHGHRLLIEELVSAINHGTPLSISPAAARNAVAIVEAIYRSSATGTTVTLS